ncbi:DNA-binding protein [Shewanella baltica]|uniref:nucleotide-binding protein n=1 Tax=Shewanella baltica TaxID=62322 RepID=UPI00217EFDD7|nr:nucleotide-binding protein [Shewanella baltica]MCS6097162.1 DNA-binding protein [Shewanella baltica]MCS6136878.1 DNA-binding protein [Shewanella baltica]MCS6228223.1 DNA-binding protein [Shewanella baltica]
MSRLPRIFIGSSSESYEVASACNACMDRSAEGTLWPKIFEPGGSTLSSLNEKANNVDFALFIFTPDDLTVMRGNEKPSIRDNVLFELGLFIGAIGQERCFILRPRGSDFFMPSDLLGINTQDYNANRSDNEIESAVSAACSAFLKQMAKLGHFVKKTNDFIKNPQFHKTYELNELSLEIIGILLPSVTNGELFTYNELNSKLKHIALHKFDLTIIKLERLSLIEKSIDSDWNGNEWVGYRLTSDGVEYALEHEEHLDKINTPMPQYLPPQNTYILPPVTPILPPELPSITPIPPPKLQD